MRLSRQATQRWGGWGRYGFEDWPTEPKVTIFLTVMAALLDGCEAA